VFALSLWQGGRCRAALEYPIGLPNFNGPSALNFKLCIKSPQTNNHQPSQIESKSGFIGRFRRFQMRKPKEETIKSILPQFLFSSLSNLRKSAQSADHHPQNQKLTLNRLIPAVRRNRPAIGRFE
jgi:hypothetical protein